MAVLFSIKERHANGSTFEASGRRKDVLAARELWIAAQKAPEVEEPEPEQPKMIGTHASAERAGVRRYEVSGLWYETPVPLAKYPFGFVPNDENEKYFGGTDD